MEVEDKNIGLEMRIYSLIELGSNHVFSPYLFLFGFDCIYGRRGGRKLISAPVDGKQTPSISS